MSFNGRQKNQRVGVLLGQTGTPDAPTPPALRRYLREFLSDTRIVDYPVWLWQPILRGIILRTRPAKSARLYKRIWLEEGSPLLIYSERQAAGLQERLGERYVIKVGMRYGQPSIKRAMDEFAAEGIERVLIFPMFPQFSTATTASIIDAVNFATAGRRGFFFERTRNIPALRFVAPYYDHPAYIEALVTTLGEQLERMDERPAHYIFSFHGVPRRFVNGGSPYAEQSQRTIELVTKRLGLDEAAWEITFQSKFGPEKWLEPATDKRLEVLGEEGLDGLAVACPGFVADCLETLDEMGNEGRESFEEAGGKGFHYLRCLNDHPVWLDGMAQIVREETAGWVEVAEMGTVRNPTAAAYVE